MENFYDVIILGAGPAGLAAGLYAGRGGLNTLLIEKGQEGGQIALTDEIENYPGQLVEGETGASLTARMSAQAGKFGVRRCTDAIQRVELDGAIKRLIGGKGAYLCKALIVATGSAHRPIGCENEQRFVGQGISYCATCDGFFFRGLHVYVVGGGDSAVKEAIYLTRFARRVTIIHRRDQLRAARTIQEKAFANPKIDFLWDSVVTKVDGTDLLSSMTVQNVKTGQVRIIEADGADGMFGLFGFIGQTPSSGIFTGLLEMENGYIITDENMHTNIPGVFAAGDVRVKTLRQVITAAADGAIAATQVEQYISDH